jgi:hypothetical protein
MKFEDKRGSTSFVLFGCRVALDCRNEAALRASKEVARFLIEWSISYFNHVTNSFLSDFHFALPFQLLLLKGK